MFIRNLETGATAILSGGILTGIGDADADATNAKAGGALMVGVSQVVWDDMVAKSTSLETLGAKLDVISSKL